MLRNLIALFTALLFAIPAYSAGIDTKAGFAYMIDADTGQTLLNKQADVLMHPSSMSKLMTVYILFHRLKEGRVTLDSGFPISEKAWRTQGSKMFVHVGDTVKVEDLIRGIIIQSGNDACIAVAEGLSGSEDAFANVMNETAKSLGLTHSHFVNATGLPDPNHMMTPRDLAILGSHVQRDFPEYNHYFTETSFVYNNIHQANRNRLLGNDIGVDGLKTGHTEDAGFGITLSAKNPPDGRRLILVINGLESDNDRMEEGNRLLHWGFREFENKVIAKAGEPVAEADVWLGAQPTIKLAAEKDAIITLPISGGKDTTFRLHYTGPIAAPIAKGTPVGELVITPPGLEPSTIPLVAAEDVSKLSGFGKIIRTLKYYIFHS